MSQHAVVESHRFMMIAAGIGVAVCISSTYAFSITTNHLKVRYGFGQDQITTISTIGTCFGMFSFPAGFLFDFAGPRFVLFVATLMMSLGFLILALALDDHIEGSVIIFSVVNILVFWASGWMDVGSLMTCILNFPRDRGSIITLQKTFMGLGSSVLATYYVAFFEGNLVAYGYFMAVMILCYGLFGVWRLHLPLYYLTYLEKRGMTAEEQCSRKALITEYEKSHACPQTFRIGYVLIGVTIVYLTAYNVTVAYVALSHTAKVTCACGSFVLLVSFFALPLSRWFAEQRLPTESGESSQPLNRTISEVQPTVSSFCFQTSFVDNLKRPLLWCLLWTSFCNLGTGVIIALNSAQIYRSLNHNSFVNSTNSLFVALMGVGSAFGRIAVGICEGKWERMRRRNFQQEHEDSAPTLEGVLLLGDANGEPPLMTSTYPIASLIFVVGLGLFLILPGDSAALIVPFVTCAFAYGFIWASTALCIRQLFAKDVGKHYNFCFLGGVLSTIALNRFLVGQLYDDEAHEQGAYPFCTGVVCFRTSFIVLIAVNTSSLASSLYVHAAFKKQHAHCQSAQTVT